MDIPTINFMDILIFGYIQFGYIHTNFINFLKFPILIHFFRIYPKKDISFWRYSRKWYIRYNPKIYTSCRYKKDIFKSKKLHIQKRNISMQQIYLKRNISIRGYIKFYIPPKKIYLQKNISDEWYIRRIVKD